MLPPLVGIFSVPIVDRWLIPKLGIEATINLGGILFGVAFIFFSFACNTDSITLLLWFSVLSSILIGFCNAACLIGEQSLLLKYSLKIEREKNIAIFRAANGVGGVFCPLFGAAMYALGGYMACFMYVGVGYLIITPFVYRSLKFAREKFAQAEENYRNR